MTKTRAAIGLAIAASVGGAVLFTLDGGAQAARCALIQGGTVILRFENAEACPPNPAGKPQFTWKPAPITTPPAFSPVTQVRIGPSYTIQTNQVVESYEVRSKTAQELDAEKTSLVDSTSEAVIRALCNHENRIRALESQSSVTLQQCKNAIKNLIP